MSEIWKFFSKITAESAKCLRCGAILSCKGSSTSGLHRHLETHNVSLKRPGNTTTDPEAGPSSAKNSRTDPQPTMLQYVKRRELNEEVARLAAKDGFSIHGITKSEFIRNAFSSRGLQLPKSPTTVMKVAGSFYATAKEDVMQEIASRLAQEQTVSLTLDEWTSMSNKRYLNINTHFMDGTMMNLGLVLVKGSLPADKIVEIVAKVLVDFGFKPNNVFGATSDAASVMVKFGKCSGYWHQLCYNHGIHLAVCDVLYKNVEEVVDESDDDDDLESDEDIVDFNDGDDADDDPGLYVSTFGETVKKVRKIVKIFRKSPIKNQLLQEKVNSVFHKPLNLLLDVKTRWNSTEAMIERFLKLWPCIKLALQDLGQDLTLTDDHITTMRELLHSLQPIRLASEALGRRDATLLTAEGSLSFLFSKLKKLNSAIAREFYDALVYRVGERRQIELVSVMKYLNNNSLSSSLELPMLSRAQLLKFMKEKVIALAKIDLEGGESSQINDPQEMEDRMELTLEQELEAAIQEVTEANTSTNEKTDITKVVQKELTLFDLNGKLSDTLQMILNNLKTIRPTSIESERVFSSSANICSKIRSSLSDKNLSMLCFLKSYFKRIDN